MTRRSLMLATAVALAFAVSAIWLWLAPTPAERPGTAQPWMESPLPADDLQPRPSVQREGVAASQVEAPARVKSIGDVLDEIGVSMTPELAEELAADGVKLDQPVEVPPWEEVHAYFEQKLGSLPQQEADDRVAAMLAWPKEVTAEALTQKFPTIGERGIELNDLQLAEISILVAEKNRFIENAAIELCDGIRYALQSEWQSGRYEKSPISTLVLPKPGRRAFYGTAAGHRAWGARVLLFSEDYPDLVALSDSAYRARKERDRQVLDYALRQPR